ncbi:hypothetical protein SEUCBS139899_009462 [Sporothrix eucalyptigena]
MKVPSAFAGMVALGLLSASPSPTCNVNTLPDGDFTSTTSPWTAGGYYTHRWYGCGDNQLYCEELDTVANTQSSISQTITGLVVNQQYTFQFDYKVTDATSDATFQCSFTGTDSNGNINTTPFTFALVSGGGWLTYTKNFSPVAATGTLQCVTANTSGYSDIFLANMVISQNC